MSKSSFEKKKQELQRRESKAKDKIRSSSNTVEAGVSNALKTGLIIGGTLFLTYQVTRLFTSSTSAATASKKKALTHR